MSAVPETLLDIVCTEMSLPVARAAIYNESFTAPKDEGLFLIASLQSTRIIASVNKFHPAEDEEDTDREIKTVTKAETWNLELSSKNSDAETRYHEVITALTSTYAQQQTEANNIRIFRTGTVNDLSFIDGAHSLRRYRIPVIIHSIERKETVIEVFDRFQAVQEETDAP